MDFTSLDLQGQVLAEYIWLGGSGSDLRSKTKVLEKRPTDIDGLPVLVVDGSVTGQATAENFEVYLTPRKIFSDPFRGSDHVLVLCEAFVPAEAGLLCDDESALKPHPSNNRVPCQAVMRLAAASQPSFMIEQEFTVVEAQRCHMAGSCYDSSKPSFCGAGSGIVIGRSLAEAHLRSCLHAGLKIDGVSPAGCEGAWAYKLGPCQGTDAADQLWISRYILLRLSERFDFAVSFDPRPCQSDWAGGSCVVEFSTRETRQPGSGIAAIQEQMARLQASHLSHMMAYGQGNMKRLLERNSIEAIRFTCGFNNKKSSITIPRSTLINRCGCYVDRRPASNMDPYLVCMLLVSSALRVPLPVGPCLAGPMSFSGKRAGCSPAASISPSGSWTRGSYDENTEDVLIDELEKIDKFAPETPPNDFSQLSSCAEGSDECSDGTSPERQGPLSAACGEDDMYL